MPAPDALLLLSTHCQHCPAVLRYLSELVKQGIVGRLEVVNLEARPEVQGQYDIRSVPWVRIGPFELHGLRSQEELAAWAARVNEETGMADYFHALLKEGQLQRVIDQVSAEGDLLADLLPIVANPEASLNVRIGAGAVIETFAATPVLAAQLGKLAELSLDPDSRVRADACHYLGLSGSTQAIPHLQACLQDPDPQVAEIAADALDDLNKRV